jgi:hypothetical protein
LFKGRQRPTVFENRVLRKMFGSVKDDVAGNRRKLHGGELHHVLLTNTGMLISP